MPYHVVKVKGGFKVAKSDGSRMSNGRRYASNKPLTKEKATSQMKAIYASENGYVLKSPKKSMGRARSPKKSRARSPKKSRVRSPKKSRVRSPKKSRVRSPKKSRVRSPKKKI